MKLYTDFWKQTFNFSGVIGIGDYWLIMFTNLIISGCCYLIYYFLFNALQYTALLFLHFIVAAYFIGIGLPTLAMTVRRFNSAKLPPGLIYLGLIPLIGWLAIFIFTLLPAQTKDNKYYELQEKQEEIFAKYKKTP